MKAILEYSLPEDHEAFKIALKADRNSILIESLFNLLRNKQKYENKKSIAIDELREWLVEELRE